MADDMNPTGDAPEFPNAEIALGPGATTQGGRFYWPLSRDELLTASAVNMFLIALNHDGEEFDSAKVLIDREYETAQGRPPSQRHGGNFQTYIRVFEESGWMTLEEERGQKVIRVTSAGKQAAALLKVAPDFLKAFPYFMVELLSRYQLNNPAGPEGVRNQAIKEMRSRSTLFPYFTIWKVMRSCDNKVTTDELRRFVFRLHSSEEVNATIENIRDYRRDLAQGMSDAEIDQKYPAPLEGAVAEPKYIMGRAGMHVGKKPPLILKEGSTNYELHESYIPFIDEVLANEPVFKDYLDSSTWMRDYGRPILLKEEMAKYSIAPRSPEARLTYPDISNDDPVFRKVRRLLEVGTRNLLLLGPPGTSKTWYALAIGAKLADYESYRFTNIQFHQSLSYEDFVQGYVPSANSDGGANGFALRAKVFLRSCEAARRDTPDRLHILVIDELNRGDPSRIFGDTLTYIERRDEEFELPSGERWLIPRNLVLIATMNPYDKSIASLDDAMDRRFNGKIRMNPDHQLLRVILSANGMVQSLAGRVVGFFDKLNAETTNRFGHAYFKDAKDLETLELTWHHSLLPALERELRFDSEKLARLSADFNSECLGPIPRTEQVTSNPNAPSLKMPKA